MLRPSMLTLRLHCLPASAFSTPVNVYGEAGSLLENAVKNCANVHFIYLGE